MKPDPTVVAEMRSYCKNLFVKWNQEESHFEVWIKMPWGDRMVTPVVQSIYSERGGNEFCPLDRRIIKWLYQADSQRKTLKRGWKWLSKGQMVDGFKARQSERYRNYKNVAKENWSLVNNEFLGAIGGDCDYVAPDVKGRRKTIMHRSSENVKKLFGEEDAIN
jgi:hypothetical protein